VRTALRALDGALAALPKSADAVAAADAPSLAALQALVTAALAGNVADYNQAVARVNDLSPLFDAALEQLRTQVNAVVTALEPVRG